MFRATTGHMGVVLSMVIAAVPAASAGPAPAGPHRASGTWAIQRTPNPPSRQGDLAGISCTSPAACTAVGHYKNFSNTVATLAEAWNGTSWSIQKTATPAGSHESYLASVSCTAADACTAVGNYRNSAGLVVTLAERWNGTSWSIQPTPNPAGDQNSGLTGVSCNSASTCTAVGFAGDFGTGSHTLAERWDGSSWSIQPTANPADSTAAFNSVSCTSAGACTAVGTAGGSVVLAEAWDGFSWSIQQTPNPTGTTAASLFGVSCLSAGACTAVGTYQAGSGAHVALAEKWNGSSWSVEPTLNPGPDRNGLNAVSCTSASACTAAGSDLSSWAVQVTMAQAWNGTSWSLQPTPNPRSFTESSLNAVACLSASACTAVGGSGTIGLAEQWNGASWSLRTAPPGPSSRRPTPWATALLFCSASHVPRPARVPPWAAFRRPRGARDPG